MAKCLSVQNVWSVNTHRTWRLNKFSRSEPHCFVRVIYEQCDIVCSLRQADLDQEVRHRMPSRGVGRSHVVAVYDPQARVDFPLEDDAVSFEAVPSPPPTEGRLEITIDNDTIKNLDLSPAHAVLRQYVAQIGDNVNSSEKNPKELVERTVGFTINYQFEDPLDPRELSELTDVRLWFARLDVAYPWLPAVLDWRGGELARYAAMLIPHQMSRRLGLVFNPEALELWTMKKFFCVYEWLRAQELSRPDARTKDMVRILGFALDDALYDIMERSPPPE